MVLDEPTAALGLRESGFLLDQVRRLRDHGLAILFITHRLPDALHISDRIVVLKGGVVQGDLSPSSCSLEDVADLIIRGGEPPTTDAPTITVVDEIKVSPRDVSTGRGYKVPCGNLVDTLRLELFDQRQWTTRALVRRGQYSESVDGGIAGPGVTPRPGCSAPSITN